MPEKYLDRSEAAAFLAELGLKASRTTLQKYAGVKSRAESKLSEPRTGVSYE